MLGSISSVCETIATVTGASFASDEPLEDGNSGPRRLRRAHCGVVTLFRPARSLEVDAYRLIEPSVPSNIKAASALESASDELVALAVLILRRQASSQSALAREMHSVGFSTARIAALLGTTANTINQSIQKAKRKERAATPARGISRGRAN
jgi:DNA-directed RNA polymerase specialized sigma24 family protein